MAILPGDRLWRVIGGTTTGGILVRKGKETSSEAASLRLETGSLIKEKELDGERLQYFRICGGMGPLTGWVSTKLKGKDLVQREEIAALDEAEPAQPLSFDAVGDRKIRVLAIHGSASNSNLLKFMMATLVRSLGKDVEWIWPEGPLDWKPIPGGTEYHETERSPFEVRISKDLPFKQWFLLSGEGASPSNVLKIDEGYQALEDMLANEAPIDAIVGFSQGANLVALYIEQLRRLGKAVPWRLNVFFSGGITNDVKCVFRKRSAHPTILITGEGDKTHNVLKGKCSDQFTNLTILEHQDGHAMPKTQPKAGEIFDAIGAHIKKHCGKLD